MIDDAVLREQSFRTVEFVGWWEDPSELTGVELTVVELNGVELTGVELTGVEEIGVNVTVSNDTVLFCWCWCWCWWWRSCCYCNVWMAFPKAIPMAVEMEITMTVYGVDLSCGC
jgi:hypothetical protein